MKEAQIKHFVALAEHKNFRNAAASLHISQSALTRSIQQLESELNCELFERSNLKTVITPFGELFMHHADQILLHMNAARKEIDQELSQQVTKINVGIGPPTKRFVAMACAKFSQSNPDIELNLLFRDWDETIEKIRKRQIDFGVTNADNYLDDDDLNIVELSDLTLKFFVHPEHPLAGKKSVTVEEFKEYPMVGGLYPIGLSQYLLDALDIKSLAEIRFIQCNNKMEMEEFLISNKHIMLGFKEYAPMHTPYATLDVVPRLQSVRPFYSIVTLKNHHLPREVVELINIVRKTERDYIKSQS